jgi:hypothetical protein
VIEIEVGKEIRGHLRPKLIDMLFRGHRIEWCSVYEFEGPRPNAQQHVLAPQLASPVDNSTQAHMGEGAPHVRVDLDQRHDSPLIVSRDKCDDRAVRQFA